MSSFEAQAGAFGMLRQAPLDESVALVGRLAAADGVPPRWHGEFALAVARRLDEEGRALEAAAAYANALELSLAAGGADDAALPLAGALNWIGRPVDAVAVLEETVRRRMLDGSDSSRLWRARARLAVMLRVVGRQDEAQALAADLAPPTEDDSPTTPSRVAEDGVEHFARALRQTEAEVAGSHPLLRMLRVHLAQALELAGRAEEALAVLADGAEAELDDPLHPAPGSDHLAALADAGRRDDELAWLRRAAATAAARAPRSGQARWLRRELAARCWDTGRPDEALALLQEVATEGGEAPDVLVLVDALLQTGRGNEARELLTAGLPVLRAGAPEDLADGLLWLAQLEHVAGDEEAVAERFAERAATLAALYGQVDPRALVAMSGHALALARSGRVAEATSIIEPCITAYSTHHDLTAAGIVVQRARAEIFALEGNLDAAWDHAASALADARELYGDATAATREALLPFALAAEAARQLDDAVEAYQAFVVDAPDEDDPACELARMRLHQLGERSPEPAKVPLALPFPERAAMAAWVRDGAEQSPEALEARWHLAESLRLKGRKLEAAEEFGRLRDDHEDGGRLELSLAAWNAAAMLWEDVAPPGVAEAEYREALERAEQSLGPDSAVTQSLRHNLADTLERRGDHDGAAWLFGQNVLAQEAASVGGINARRRLAWSLALSQRLQQALLVARRGLADAEATLTPGAEATLDIRNTLAFCLEMLGDEGGALELFEQNLVEGESTLGAASSVVLPYRNNLARLYLSDGRLDEALALYRTSAEAVRPAVAAGEYRDVEVLRHLAECLGRTDAAQEAAEAHGDYVAAVVKADGEASDRAHRARQAWARVVVAAAEDASANVAAIELHTKEEAYAAAAVLAAAGDLAGSAAIRLRFDLDEGPGDVDEATTAFRARVAEALSMAMQVREMGGGEPTRGLLAEILAECRSLPADDPARSGAALTLGYALREDGLPEAAQDVLRAEYDAMLADGTVGTRAGRMTVGFLREGMLERLDWEGHDDLLAEDHEALTSTIPVGDERAVLARVLLAGALRRRGFAAAAQALVAEGQAALTGDETEGTDAILRIALTKALGDPTLPGDGTHSPR